MIAKEEDDKISNITKYAMKAQAPYKTMSMSEVTNYTGPPKYLKQRDQPLEIPIECIRKLADQIDTSMDERCEIEEIEDFVRRREIPFEEGIIPKMFAEAASGRGYITDKQM